MRGSLAWTVCVSVFVGTLLLGSGGCGDSTGPDDRDILPPDPTYAPPNTPRRAIHNYRLAWDNRDSVMIDSTVAADYQGTSVDMADPAPVVLTFSKSDEVRAVGGLAGDARVTRVSVNFPDSTTWVAESRPGDPSDWVTITIPSALIDVDQGSNSFHASTGSMEFKVKPVVTAPDTTWQIVRWSEVNQP